MDPFRDELAAAHAKIAELEERVRHLEQALHDAYKSQPQPTARFAAPARSILIGAIAAFALSAVIGVFILISIFSIARAQPKPASSASFNGIATAVTPEAAVTAAPTSTATSSTKPNAKPCNCSPGDPLCSCL